MMKKNKVLKIILGVAPLATLGGTAAIYLTESYPTPANVIFGDSESSTQNDFVIGEDTLSYPNDSIKFVEDLDENNVADSNDSGDLSDDNDDDDDANMQNDDSEGMTSSRSVGVMDKESYKQFFRQNSLKNFYEESKTKYSTELNNLTKEKIPEVIKKLKEEAERAGNPTSGSDEFWEALFEVLLEYRDAEKAKGK